MYHIEGDIVKISLDMDLDEVKELKEFITPRLKYIDLIEIEWDEKDFFSSSIFQLLIAIKNSAPQINIPILKSKVKFENFGTANWELQDG